MKKYLSGPAIILLVVAFLLSSCSPGEVILTDFEGDNFEEWVVTGDAFGTKPVKADTSNPGWNVFGQQGVGQNGFGYVSISTDNPDAKGTLTSPVFSADKKYLVFLFAASNLPDKLRVDLIQEGKVLKTMTGNNERTMVWRYFELNDLTGQNIQVQIVDSADSNSRGGRLLADFFYMSNEKPIKEDSLYFKISKKYINLPVRPGDARKQLILTADGKVMDRFTIELADSAPAFYAFIDMEKYIGKEASLYTPVISTKSNAFDLIAFSNEIKGIESIYKEPRRQQFHFSSKRGWNNDPNGLVYYKGEYHMFYQHNPYGSSWGNMHWGHAVSTDLIHWQELPTAIYPFQENDAAFSGSAAMDFNNTGGFKIGSEDVMIAAYTSTGRGECILYSNDKGRTLNEYAGNPVLEHNGRDPKIFWYEPGNHWVMAVYDQTNQVRSIQFYTSSNLRDWEYQSQVDGLFECPELFQLPVDGNPITRKWVLYAADGAYYIGTFNGKIFIKESELIPNNYGNCFYASQTFNNIPDADGRRIQIGWARGVNTPDAPFNQGMLFPAELTLRMTTKGIRMCTEPIKEIEQLHLDVQEWADIEIGPGSPANRIAGELFHIKGVFMVNPDSEFGFKIHGTDIVYNAATKELSCMDLKAPVETVDGRIYLEILVDRNIIEIFCNYGEVYMPIARDLTKDYGLEFISNKGTTIAPALQVFDLKSIWEQ